ncbi:hypothetical protein [Nannocystis pusilla]|uniref:hypothetical protein n=1 Tax=Nannocystis pusilla TaxID=889268 RepID=UPI003BF0F8D8
MLGLRFSRLVHAAIASGALLLGACPDAPGDTETGTESETETDSGDTASTTAPDPTTGFPPPPPPPPGDITPPAIAAVTMIDAFTLQLSFTEAIAPVDTVNPKRFRLSLARGYFGNYGGQPATYLRDLQYYNLVEYCPPPPPGCYYDPQPYYCYYGGCYYQPLPIAVADVFNHYADPTQVILSLTAPIQPSLCNILQAPEDPLIDFVLHLHYASGGLAQITDLAGLPLPSLADAWVKDPNNNYYNYLNAAPFSNFNPFLPIPCTLF